VRLLLPLKQNADRHSWPSANHILVRFSFFDENGSGLLGLSLEIIRSKCHALTLSLIHNVSDRSGYPDISRLVSALWHGDFYHA
jgi:hypothetical protein